MLHWVAFATSNDPETFEYKKFTSVRLSEAEHSLTAGFLTGSTLVRTIAFPEDRFAYRCAGNAFVLDRMVGAAAPFSGTVGKECLELMRATDGSLLVKFGINEGGVAMMVVPVGNSTYNWIRYASAAIE